ARVGRGIFNHRIPVRSKDELGQLAEALNAMTEKIEASIGGRLQAERASEIKSAFLANMSHEIRTPLAAILGFADALKDPTLDPAERAQYLGIIDRNGHALTKVIDDILDLSKVEAGGLVVENLEFSLPTLLQDAVDLFTAAALSKGLKIELRVESTARKAVCADPTRLRQILTNVIGNALKFTSEGGISIHGEVVPRDGREFIRISIKDTGIGLTEKQIEKLFSPFTQADGSTTRKYGGTGLGLALSRKLAQAMGGNVTVGESVFNHGSTFIVEIENNLGIPALKMAPAAPMLPAKDVSKMKVLAVEDSPDNRQLLEMILSRQGIRADFASNGKEAIDLAMRSPYDMILMDIQMPEMDGYEALAKLQANHYSKPIVALTAHALKEERDRCLSAGFIEHLAKPIDERALVNLIAKFSERGA
ncbi:MAG TPA: response regulator, partial [Bdellovibrionales bacterium]|nr:response regulator [Bdellovibrionales bacterium]